MRPFCIWPKIYFIIRSDFYLACHYCALVVRQRLMFIRFLRDFIECKSRTSTYVLNDIKCLAEFCFESDIWLITYELGSNCRVSSVEALGSVYQGIRSEI